ncbi:hypothetical protein T07_13605 [Trichinella nelsoni]|uniref:Uncharacterized protein n=1 Tax=Trichinella nelsoni TaxID=6336 RepID=A0A0V0S4N6_9BILA|nr:hypothetical protein T07_13605 [Trichinella nelsoni]
MNNDELHEAVEKAENEDVDESDKANEEPSHSEAFSSFTFGLKSLKVLLLLLLNWGEGMLWSESIESSIGNLLKYPRPSDVAIRIDKTPNLNGKR